ncbi:MAG: nitrogenase [Clostridiales bacterium]|nr:nitrogenase [Clostridiales bacterium]
MIRRLGGDIPVKDVRIADAACPAPFAPGLEFSPPARGTWNIVHTGMLIPEAHEIFVCAEGCLRGVVLTAAEMGASDRFSTVAVRENNVTDGDLEDSLIEGVTDILEKLPKKPPAVLVYTSCIHHFMGADLPHIYKTLRERFPDIDFTDCYMNPIMRKSGLTPDQLMRRQLYSLLHGAPRREKTVLISGNNFMTDDGGDFPAHLREHCWELFEIQRCKTYAEYQALAGAALCLTNQPAAIPGGKLLSERFGMTHLHLPISFDYGEIEANWRTFCAAAGIPEPDFGSLAERCEDMLTEAKREIGDAPIEIDYTVTSRPLSLALMLLRHGFCVTRIYLDGVSGEEAEDFAALQKRAPDLLLSPTVDPVMRVRPRETREKTLAVGQKAAWFTGSGYFVNLVENGGLYGYEAVRGMAALMRDAWRTPKDARRLIQIKGMGCASCL